MTVCAEKIGFEPLGLDFAPEVYNSSMAKQPQPSRRNEHGI